MLKSTLRLRNFSLKNLINTHIQVTQYSCMCGHVYFKDGDKKWRENARVHSTQSDQHRQKVIIETSTPNVIDKINYEKVLPIDKEEKKFELWDKIDPYVKLARWDKPVGVYLLYYPCSWSIACATVSSGAPLCVGLYTGGLFLVGAGLMRGAGCTLNDMWDRDIDRQVSRTQSRPLAAGTISLPQATAFLALQLSASALVLAQLNCYSVVLGASSLLLVATYPLAKRFTGYPQLFLGGTFNWGALLGYSAVSGALGLPAAALYAGALAWTVVYDTIYAHQDKLDDARIGIKSTALTFGEHTKPILYATLLTSGACLYTAMQAAELSHVSTVGVAAYVATIARQIYTLDINNPSDCADKFKANSYIGLIILAAIIGGGVTKYKENSERRKAQTHVYNNHESCLKVLFK